MNVVIDASVSGAWLLPVEASRRADKLLRGILNGELEAQVPGLWTYEITNLLTMAARRHRLDPEGFREALRLVSLIPRRSHPQDSPECRTRIALLAERFRLSAYDAAYLELGDQLRCGVATLDDAVRRAAVALSLPGV